LHLAFALQLAFADRQGGGKTDDYLLAGKKHVISLQRVRTGSYILYIE
jgi:hypothetical protein